MTAARWLLFLDRTMSLEDYFSDIHVPVNCEFLVAQEQDVTKDKCSAVTLREVFRVHWSHPLQTYSKGVWSSCDGFAWSTVPFDKRRGDLHGAVIPSGINSAVSSVALRMAGNRNGYIRATVYMIVRISNKFLLINVPCIFYYCTMTNKCTIISQIITQLHVSTLSCHPRGACNQYFAKLHKYFKCSCWYCNLKLRCFTYVLISQYYKIFKILKLSFLL